MIDVEVKIRQPAGFDVKVWNFPLNENGEYRGEKPQLLDIIFCCTKREAAAVKKAIANRSNR